MAPCSAKAASCSWKEAWEESALLDSLQIAHAADRAHSYPHELSGGMRQRVGIAMALANHPDLIIADEPTTALDVTVQWAVIDLLRKRIRDSGTALLFISHDLALVSELCERVMVMRRGEIVEQGATAEILRSPRHDYTRGLLESLPSAERAPFWNASKEPVAISFRSVGKQFSGRSSGFLRAKRPVLQALDAVTFDIPRPSRQPSDDVHSLSHGRALQMNPARQRLSFSTGSGFGFSNGVAINPPKVCCSGRENSSRPSRRLFGSAFNRNEPNSRSHTERSDA